MTAIPDDLAQLVTERRIIPFVGAGFSAAVDLPDWNDILRRLASDTTDCMPYEKLKEFATGDFLQIAEYLLLQHDERIGPLRHILEQCLGTDKDPLLSPVHIELANLGAPQIYTTNYDDLIERTFNSLHLSSSVVALPKDVALADSEITQIVKYHGDLRHEETLVLTESSYFKRLDFESPMDLKFRSDLLGRAVLFMGYSFTDINIRYIWFKLMKMMQDIPARDRRQSYIVRPFPNPVLEELYRAVGLETIVLDRAGKTADDSAGQSDLLGEFLFDLSEQSSSSGNIPGRDERMFVSPVLITRLNGLFDPSEKPAQNRYFRSLGMRAPREVLALSNRQYPIALSRQIALLSEKTFKVPQSNPEFLALADRLAREFGPSGILTDSVMKTLTRGTRRLLLASKEFPWEVVWKGRITDDQANGYVKLLRREISYHQEGNSDGDLAYLVDLVSRIRDGIVVGSDSQDIVSAATSAIAEAGELYSSALSYTADPSGPPDPQAILEEIEANDEDKGNGSNSPSGYGYSDEPF